MGLSPSNSEVGYLFSCTHLHVHTCICHKYVFVSECVLHIPTVSVLMCLCTWRSSFWASVECGETNIFLKWALDGFGAHTKRYKKSPGILVFLVSTSDQRSPMQINSLHLRQSTVDWTLSNKWMIFWQHKIINKMLFFRFQATKRTMSCLKSSKMKRLPISGNQLVWPFDPKPSMQIPAAVTWQWQRTTTGWRIVCEQHHGMAKFWNSWQQRKNISKPEIESYC